MLDTIFVSQYGKVDLSIISRYKIKSSYMIYFSSNMVYNTNLGLILGIYIYPMQINDTKDMYHTYTILKIVFYASGLM